MSQFHNPYHFVPVAAIPGPGLIPRDLRQWPPHLTHDRFVTSTQYPNSSSPQEVFCGHIVCRLQIEQLTAVGSQQTEGSQTRPRLVKPFRLGDQLAFPGSSLRGLISSITEAASNSALRVLNDEPLSLSQGRGAPRKSLGRTYDYFKALGNLNLLPLHEEDGRTQLTLAEQLFGFVEIRDEPYSGTQLAHRSSLAMSGRLCFSSALRQAAEDNGLSQSATTKILDSPKPPSPALYLRRHDGSENYIPRLSADPHEHVPQGRKFYLHHGKLENEAWQMHPEVSSLELKKQHLQQRANIQPINIGQSFWFHVSFDNLSLLELQLLCYALRPSEKFRHKLGLAKPLGLGTVRIDPAGLFLIHRLDRYAKDDLFGSRYHRIWRDEALTFWPSGYHREQYCVGARATPPATMAADYEKFIVEQFPALCDALVALQLIGDPAAVRAPVHYPQPMTRRIRNLASGHDEIVPVEGVQMEQQSYEWFVGNDRAAGQMLRPLDGELASLPTLERLPSPAAPHPTLKEEAMVDADPAVLKGRFVPCIVEEIRPNGKIQFKVKIGKGYPGAFARPTDLNGFRQQNPGAKEGDTVSLKVAGFTAGSFQLNLPSSS